MPLYDRIPLSVKPDLGAQIRTAAAEAKLSVTAWIARACEAALRSAKTKT